MLENAGSQVSAASDELTVKAGTWLIEVQIPITGVSGNNPRKAATGRLISEGVVIEGPVGTHYRRGSDFDGSDGIMHLHFLVYFAADTTFKIQTASLFAQTNQVVNSRAGGIIKVVRWNGSGAGSGSSALTLTGTSLDAGGDPVDLDTESMRIAMQEWVKVGGFSSSQVQPQNLHWENHRGRIIDADNQGFMNLQLPRFSSVPSGHRGAFCRVLARGTGSLAISEHPDDTNRLHANNPTDRTMPRTQEIFYLGASRAKAQNCIFDILVEDDGFVICGPCRLLGAEDYTVQGRTKEYAHTGGRLIQNDDIDDGTIESAKLADSFDSDYTVDMTGANVLRVLAPGRAASTSPARTGNVIISIDDFEFKRLVIEGDPSEDMTLIIDALDTSISNWKVHASAHDDNIGIPFAMLNKSANNVAEFRYVAAADDGIGERLGANFAENYRLDVGNVASCVVGGDFRSTTFGSTDFSMHSTGRPSSVHETGLLGFANEYYREMPPTSSTLQTLIANVLSGGGTGSRTTAIRNYIDGDYVRQAYADEEMDEKIGCFRLLAARHASGTRETFSIGHVLPFDNEMVHLFSVHFDRITSPQNEMVHAFSDTIREQGDWVLVGGRVITNSRIAVVNDPAVTTSVGLWMRYA